MSIFSSSERRSAWSFADHVAGFAAVAALAFTLAAPAAGVAGEKTRVDLHGGDRITVSSGNGLVVIRHGDSTVDSVRNDGVSVRVHGDIVRKGLQINLDDGETGLVRMFSDITIQPDQHVAGDVVALFGNITVKGEVTGTTVAVMGSIKLEPGSRVVGDAVSVGGGVDQADGADVSGQTVSVGLLPVAWGMPALPVVLGFTLAGWLSALFFGWLFALLFPTPFVRVAATASRRTAASFFLGLVSVPLAILTGVLLFVTVIGIPVAILLPLVYGLMIYAGQMAATYLLGCKFTQRRPGDGRGLLAPLAAGLTFVAVFFVAGALLGTASGALRIGAVFFSLLGVLLVVALSSTGTGAFLLSRFGREPRDLVHDEHMVLPSPSAPPPATPAPTGA
jgi:cytoskeletal protein CcmA (bactofilin family)